MILCISFGGQRLAVTVQPSRKPSVQPAADQTSALLFGHTLGKALSQTFGGCA
jgi:hypothetical protein